MFYMLQNLKLTFRGPKHPDLTWQKPAWFRKNSHPLLKAGAPKRAKLFFVSNKYSVPTYR